MSPQEPQNSGPKPVSPQNPPSVPEDPQIFSTSPADAEPTTVASPELTPESESAGTSPAEATEISEPAVTTEPAQSTESTELAQPEPTEAAEVTPAEPVGEPVVPVEVADEYIPVPMPVPDSEEASADPAVPAHKKTPKKIIAVVIAAVLVLLALGGGVAFAVWYTSPQKVLNDSLTNFMNTPPKSINATSAVSVQDTNVKVVVTTYTDGSDNAQAQVKFDVTSGDTAVNINVDAIAAKNGDLYIRINDAKKLRAQLAQGSPDTATKFEGILTKVDAKWVKIAEADIKKISGQNQSPNSECANNAVAAFQSDAAQKKEVSDLYAKNQFITVKDQKADEVVDGRNSFHYVLNTDQAKAKSFAEGLKQTKVYKKITACLGDSFKDDSSAPTAKTDDDTTTSVEVWIDKSTRQISKLGLIATSAEEKANAKIEALFGYTTKSITTPATSIGVNDLQQEIEDIFGDDVMSNDTEFETSAIVQ